MRLINHPDTIQLHVNTHKQDPSSSNLNNNMSQTNKSPSKPNKTLLEVNLDALKALVDTTILSTKEAKEGKEAINFGVEEDFKLVHKETRKAIGKADPLITFEKDTERHQVVALNWLVKVNKDLITKVNEQAEAIKKLNLLQSAVTRVEKRVTMVPSVRRWRPKWRRWR